MKQRLKFYIVHASKLNTISTSNFHMQLIYNKKHAYSILNVILINLLFDSVLALVGRNYL